MVVSEAADSGSIPDGRTRGKSTQLIDYQQNKLVEVILSQVFKNAPHCMKMQANVAKNYYKSITPY
jgi:hypothetical protein